MIKTKAKISGQGKKLVRCSYCGHEMLADVGWILPNKNIDELRPFYIFDDNGGDVCPHCDNPALYVPSEVELQREGSKPVKNIADLNLPPAENSLHIVKIGKFEYSLEGWDGQAFQFCHAISREDGKIEFMTDQYNEAATARISPVYDDETGTIIAFELF